MNLLAILLCYITKHKKLNIGHLEKTSHFPVRRAGRSFDRDWGTTEFVDWTYIPKPERVVDFAFPFNLHL